MCLPFTLILRRWRVLRHRLANRNAFELKYVWTFWTLNAFASGHFSHNSILVWAFFVLIVLDAGWKWNQRRLSLSGSKRTRRREARNSVMRSRGSNIFQFAARKLGNDLMIIIKVFSVSSLLFTASGKMHGTQFNLFCFGLTYVRSASMLALTQCHAVPCWQRLSSF